MKRTVFIPLIFAVFAGSIAACNSYQIPMKANTRPQRMNQSVRETPVQRRMEAVEAPPRTMSGRTVIVRKGDTVYSIAKRSNVPLRAFIVKNDLSPPYTLSVGQKLYLPAAQEHTVETKDTIYSISRKYNVDMTSLVRLNKLDRNYSIYVGQKLAIPDTVITEKTAPPYQAYKLGTAKPAVSSPAGKGGKAAGSKKTAAVKEKSVIPTAPSLSSRGGRFVWPVKGTVLSKFGPSGKGRHNDGINISAPEGAPVVAVENGVVAYAGNEIRGFGNLLLIKHDKGWMSAYAHLKESKVKRGQEVKAGEKIGSVGKTGNASKSQLHFELRNKAKAVDPELFLKAL